MQSCVSASERSATGLDAAQGLEQKEPSVNIMNGFLKDSSEYFRGGKACSMLIASEHKFSKSQLPKDFGLSANLAKDKTKNFSAL